MTTGADEPIITEPTVTVIVFLLFIIVEIVACLIADDKLKCCDPLAVRFSDASPDRFD